MDYQSIIQAAQRAGIADSFTAIDGIERFTSLETKQRLLQAMNGLSSIDNPPPLPAAKVFRLGEFYHFKFSPLQTASWTLKSESGIEYSGILSSEGLLALPSELPTGYHQLTLHSDSNSWQSRIIIAPPRCFEPDSLLSGHKLWGTCIQLYTLRSAQNWGIGDFSDLYQMIGEIAARGGAFVGINPIHALYPANPESASPYSPSSRQWLNIIYIDVAAVIEFQESPEAQQWWQSALIQQQIRHARIAEWVDYSSVSFLKIQALRLAFNYFQQQDAGHARQQDFQRFIQQSGESLRQHATFDALHMALNIGHENNWGWPVWPKEYQDSNSEQVRLFAEQNSTEILFCSWLQWLAHQQLERCYQVSQTQAMPIGLYRDLAVGVSEGSAATWLDRQLYCVGASIGAPPDPLGPLGQNWGLPPMDPLIMQARGYQPFIELLRANMSCCGALRIDHVMALLRLWWIPYGESSDRGAYVHYPVDDLLGILALESQRHHCMIIGEDLGTVPLEIIDKLRNSGVYSYRVLYFQHDDNKQFAHPHLYPVQAMATVNTHDLPTLRAFWMGSDLTLGSDLGLYPDRYKLNALYHERNASKQGLLDTLRQCGYEFNEDEQVTLTVPISDELSSAIQQYMASSHSALLGLQLEDWQGIVLPVNIPGTSNQYANWRRKLTKSVSEMFNDKNINLLLEAINHKRQSVK